MTVSVVPPAAAKDPGRPLAEQSIRIVVEPPGPHAKERIAHDTRFVSPSLIFVRT